MTTSEPSLVRTRAWPIWALSACVALTGCLATAPQPPAERPAALLSAVAFDRAIDHAVDDLLAQAQRLPDFQPPPPANALTAMLRKDAPAPVKPLVVVDNALDGSTGQQTAATRLLDARLIERVSLRLPAFRVESISALAGTDPTTARFVLTPAVTALEMRSDKAARFRVNLSLTDARNGFVVAQAAAQATAETVDPTPTHLYRDSPSLTKDRTVEGQIRTAQTEAGEAADGVYLSNLSVAALIAQGARLYEAGQYEQALSIYEAAAARPDGRHLRIYNGLYLSNMQLGRPEAAEKAFSQLVMLGLSTNTLSVKFLFKPGSTDFWPDPKVSGAYPMWLRVLSREIASAGTCITVAGHTSRSGPEALNDRLSLMRAAAIQKRLEANAPGITGRLQATGIGFRENLIGTGTDDARDALDRRVEFRVRGC